MLLVFEERAVCAVPRPALSGPPPSTPLPPALSNRVTLGQVTPLPDCLTHPNIFLLLTKIFLIPVTRDMSDSWIRNIGTGVFWLELCIIVPVMSCYSEQELPVKYFRSL